MTSLLIVVILFKLVISSTWTETYSQEFGISRPSSHPPLYKVGIPKIEYSPKSLFVDYSQLRTCLGSKRGPIKSLETLLTENRTTEGSLDLLLFSRDSLKFEVFPSCQTTTNIDVGEKILSWMTTLCHSRIIYKPLCRHRNPRTFFFFFFRLPVRHKQEDPVTKNGDWRIIFVDF